MSQPEPLLVAARFDWWGSPAADACLLEEWRSVPTSYTPGQAREGAGSGWHTDQYRVPLGADAAGRLFAAGAARLLRYQFYPPDVLIHTSDFGQQQRAARPGDRIVQRIRVAVLLGRPALDVLVLSEVSTVTDEPRRAGLAYITTRQHDEVGQWSVLLERHADDTLELKIDSLSRPAPYVPLPLHPLFRWLQLRAHQRGIEDFRSRLEAAH